MCCRHGTHALWEWYNSQTPTWHLQSIPERWENERMQINHPSLPRSLRFESTRSLSDQHRSVKRTSLASRNENHKATFDWIPKLCCYAWLCFPDPFCAHISALYSRTQRGPMSKGFVVVNDRFNFPLPLCYGRSISRNIQNSQWDKLTSCLGKTAKQAREEIDAFNQEAKCIAHGYFVPLPQNDLFS